MILKTHATPAIASDGLESSVMGVNMSRMAEMTEVLRDSIYTRHIFGIIRELATNGFDEHKKYNVDRPVEIGIRYNDDRSHTFYVRDYAKGLNDHNVRNVFAMYMESSKRDSNDYIGCRGVGAKIPLCYTDSYFITSNFEGKQTNYVISLDEHEGHQVSKIFKVSEHDTDETGIEVSLDIKSGDLSEFKREIKNFISHCSVPVIGKGVSNDGDIMPLIPVNVFDKGCYRFKTFKGDSQSVIYRMGEITYKIEKHNSLNSGIDLVVEIPIGKMMLPISREAFKDTRANREVLTEIRGYIQELENQDMETFAKYTVNDLLKDRDNTHFIGQIFTCKKTKVFPGTAQIISSLRKTFYGENAPDFEKFENKIVIGVIPNNKAKDMWMDRLMAFSKEQNTQYWSIVDSPDIQDSNLPKMIDQHFVFKKVKSKFFPMKKAETGGKKDSWVVCEQRNGRSKYNIHKIEYTALELHNEARRLLKLEEAEDLEEAALQMQDMVYNSNTELHMFTIFSRNGYGSHCPYWWTSSQKLRDQLKAIGWFILYDTEYTEINNRLNDIERKQQAERRLVESCYPAYITCQLAEKRKAVLPNRIRRAEKISELIQTIKSENSLRGRMLKSFESNYYAPKMNRHEFRQIMKLCLTNNPIGV